MDPMMKKVVFVACSGIGYLIGHYFGQGATAVYASIMISYHLYLAFLLITAEKEVGFSLPIVQTILTHVACVGMVVLIPVARHFIPFFGIVRLFIPAIAPFEADWLFSGGKKKAVAQPEPEIAPEMMMPETPWKPTFMQDASAAAAPDALAVDTHAPQPAVVAAVPAAAPPAWKPAVAAAPAPSVPGSAFAGTTADEYEEFLAHLREGKRPFRKPGITVKQEFELWYMARAKKHHASAATSQSA
jgi:hypothetical protein